MAGTDAEGSFVALVGSQDGLPDECPFAVRYGGREWVDSIESQGVVWQKAPGFERPGFESEVNLPAAGDPYPDNAILCLDGDARVTRVMLARPPTDDPGAVGSAAPQYARASPSTWAQLGQCASSSATAASNVSRVSRGAPAG